MGVMGCAQREVDTVPVANVQQRNQLRKENHSIFPRVSANPPPSSLLLPPFSFMTSVFGGDRPWVQIHKSPMLSATLGRRYFLGILPAVRYASDQIAGGMLIAPPDKYYKVMSNLSLGHTDEHQLQDI